MTSPDLAGSTSISARHRQHQRQELETSYQTLSLRIEALRKDFYRELDAERRQVLGERLTEQEAERDQIVKKLGELEEPAQSSNSPGDARENLPANPFGETLAVRDPARFIGREAELRRVEALLAGGSVALIGQPRIGKSSLLWQLAARWREKQIGPIDCMDLDGPEDLYERLAEALDLDRAGWRSLRGALKNASALLLLDELDAGALRGLTHADLGRLRAVCQENRRFRVAAVSRHPLKDVFPDPGMGSRAYDFLQPLTLGPLAEGEARRLLAHPWAPAAPLFDPAAAEGLLTMAAGHPFKLQRLAFHRYETLADPAYDWQTAYQQDMEHLL